MLETRCPSAIARHFVSLSDAKCGHTTETVYSATQKVRHMISLLHNSVGRLFAMKILRKVIHNAESHRFTRGGRCAAQLADNIEVSSLPNGRLSK